MLRASDIYGAPAGPSGPALNVGIKSTPPPAKPAVVAPFNSGDNKPGGGGFGPSRPQGSGGASFSPYGGKGGGGKEGGARSGGKASWQPGGPNTVSLLGAGSLPPGVEKDIEDEARKICILNSFSTPDEVRYVSASLAFIDFPYQEACRDFMRVTNNMLKVRSRVYKMSHSGGMQSEAEQEAALTASMDDYNSDTLMVRLIGDLDEVQIKKAFQTHVPVVKSVRMMVDRSTRKSKGFCFVSFWSVSDAMTAKNRLAAAGSMIEHRKVALSFAKPQTHEAALESDLNARAEKDFIATQAQTALTGINAEMWSSYMQFCDEETNKQNREKEALLQVIETKKRMLKARAEAAEKGTTEDENAGNSAGSSDPPSSSGTSLSLSLGTAPEAAMQPLALPAPVPQSKSASKVGPGDPTPMSAMSGPGPMSGPGAMGTSMGGMLGGMNMMPGLPGGGLNLVRPPALSLPGTSGMMRPPGTGIGGGLPNMSLLRPPAGGPLVPGAMPMLPGKASGMSLPGLGLAGMRPPNGK